MPTHWTYSTFRREDGLYQGDIIAREPILQALAEVHKHFTDPKYLAFVVLTQTCDLVVRHKACKAKHISLAVVRPLSALVPVFLEEHCKSPAPRLFKKDQRPQAQEFLRKVLNQNEQAQGWFYLHPDGDVGVGEPAVAMLRITISLRAHEHYEMLREARCGRLETEFRNKLGWLKGNLYSRIDTTDWSERDSGGEEESRIINDLLDAPIGGHPPLWFPSAWIDAANKQQPLGNVPTDQIELVIRKHAPQPPLEVALAEVTRVVGKLSNEFTDRAAIAFSERVAVDPCLPTLLAQAIFQVFEPIHAETEKLYGHFARDAMLQALMAAKLRQHAQAFASRPGPRDVDRLVESLAASPILSVEALTRVGVLAEQSFGSAWLDNQNKLDPVLEDLPPSPEVVEYLRMVIISAIQKSLPERTAETLRNSAVFKKAVKKD